MEKQSANHTDDKAFKNSTQSADTITNRKPNKSFRGRNKDVKKQQSRGRSPFAGCAVKQDPFFYAMDQTAIENMASFPFLDVVTETYPFATRDATPGIAVFNYYPLIGTESESFSIDDNARSNYKTRAADAYYQYVTQGFTGAVNFEAPDLLMTAIAGASLEATILEGIRAYGLTKYYLQQNSAYARLIISALGFDFDDLIQNLANFRTELNIRIEQFNKLVALPKGFMISERYDLISSLIFTDTESPEWSTALAYHMLSPLIYSATYMNTGTSLLIYSETSDGMEFDALSVDSYFSMLDDLMNALTDDDVRDIFGAIRRVYDSSNLKTLNQLSEDYLTPIVKNDQVSFQIHNARWDSTISGWAPSEMRTDTESSGDCVAMFQGGNGAIRSYAISSATGDPAYDQYPLDMYDHDVTPGNVLDATANMQVTLRKYPDTQSPQQCLVACRCEALLSLYLVTQDLNDSIKKTWYYNPSSSTSAEDIKSLLKYAAMSHIDSHPLIDIVDQAPGYSATAVRLGVLGEIDKYTAISARELSLLHKRSQYQLLAMPANSKSVTK
nr:putative capsid [Marmot picobirnavirus]